VDHIIPLAKGGQHHPRNLQVISANDNVRKGAKAQPPIEQVGVMQA
jgi:5-methylcytosine-specific restriction endonuclease McrA